MKILFVHQHFPGQFPKLVRHFAQQGEHEIVALTSGQQIGQSNARVSGVRYIHYAPERDEVESNHVLRSTVEFAHNAYLCARKAEELAKSGWVPDVIYAHTGWGPSAFLKEIFPSAKAIKYLEWYYNNVDGDSDFLAADRPLEGRIQTSLMNMPILLDCTQADLLVSPTEWQKSQFPSFLRERIQVVPDGIDVDWLCPSATASFQLPNGRELTGNDRVVTYATRGADPYRGFEQFLQALALAQAEDPHLEGVILGDQKVHYGPGNGADRYCHDVMSRANFDPARTHFLGFVPYKNYRKLLQISAVHVYLTVPFVLSWSALEALSCGCLLVASDTPPVSEFVTHGENGFLCDFFDVRRLADTILHARNADLDFSPMRAKARQTILERWSTAKAMERHTSLLSGIM